MTKTPPPSVLAFDPEVIALASYTTGPCEGPGAAVFVNLSAYKDWIKATCKSCFSFSKTTLFCSEIQGFQESIKWFVVLFLV